MLPDAPDAAHAQSLINDGLNALQANDRDRAYELLTAAVQVEPRSERAWFGLAAAAPSTNERRAGLERVLAINPHHAIARIALVELGPPSLPLPLSNGGQNISAPTALESPPQFVVLAASPRGMSAAAWEGFVVVGLLLLAMLFGAWWIQSHLMPTNPDLSLPPTAMPDLFAPSSRLSPDRSAFPVTPDSRLSRTAS